MQFFVAYYPIILLSYYPGAWCLVPGAWCLLPTTYYLLPTTYYLLLYETRDLLLKYSAIEKLPSSIYASNTGRPGYPLLTFPALLFGRGDRLSDV